MFISCLVVLSALYYFCLTETNQLTLESIAGKFGDDTVSTDKAVVAMGVGDHELEDKNVAGTIVEQGERV